MFFFLLTAEAASLTYNGETRRLFVGLNNGTISVSDQEFLIQFIFLLLICTSSSSSKGKLLTEIQMSIYISIFNSSQHFFGICHSKLEILVLFESLY